MTATALLTLGRLPKGLDLARALSQCGWRVIIAEPQAWHLSRLSRSVARCYRVPSPAAGKAAYQDALREICEREGVDLVLPVSEEAMHVAGLAESLPAGTRLFGIAQSQLLRLHHKGRFIERARQHGLAVPESALSSEPEAAAIAASGAFVCKPVFSCSGKGVSLHPAGALPASPDSEPVLVQRRLVGDVYSTFSVAYDGATRLTSIYRPRVLSGSVAVCFERVPLQPAIEAWVRQFVAAERYTGFIAFDFFVSPDGIAQAIECNPRMTSGVHFLRPEALAALVLDEPLPDQPFRPESLLQQFYPCLTEVQAAFGDWPRWRERLAALRAARDVTWAWRDPLPFLLMPLASASIIWQALRRGVPFGEVATLDIDWFDGEACP